MVPRPLWRRPKTQTTAPSPTLIPCFTPRTEDSVSFITARTDDSPATIGAGVSHLGNELQPHHHRRLHILGTYSVQLRYYAAALVGRGNRWQSLAIAGNLATTDPTPPHHLSLPASPHWSKRRRPFAADEGALTRSHSAIPTGRAILPHSPPLAPSRANLGQVSSRPSAVAASGRAPVSAAATGQGGASPATCHLPCGAAAACGGLLLLLGLVSAPPPGSGPGPGRPLPLLALHHQMSLTNPPSTNAGPSSVSAASRTQTLKRSVQAAFEGMSAVLIIIPLPRPRPLSPTFGSVRLVSSRLDATRFVSIGLPS